MEQKYNGYTNRETWLVMLWINNEPGPYFYWEEQTSETLRTYSGAEAYSRLTDALEEWCQEQGPQLGATLFADLLSTALARVQWGEIAESLIDGVQESSSHDPVVYVYSRKQALADGVLIDAGNLAKETGFTVPVALTSTVWESYVRVPAAVPWQDETGRLWDILTMLRHAIRAEADSREARFKVLVQNDEKAPELVELKAISGPGDDGEHVLTIMLPNED